MKELEELQAKLADIDTQLGINISEVDMSDVVVSEEDDDTTDYSKGSWLRFIYRPVGDTKE